MHVMMRLVIAIAMTWGVNGVGKAQQVTPISNNSVMFFAFEQGPVAGGGNCAAIALCKSAILTFGLGGVFTYEENQGFYNVVLRSGEKVVLSSEELATAKSECGFVPHITGTDAAERKAVYEYAQLCYAVMAKMVMAHGDGHLGTASEGDSCRYSKFETAIVDLNNGGFTPTNYHLLGLDAFVVGKRTWASTKHVKAGVTWSNKHAMFLSYGHCDRYGKRKRLWRYPQSGGRLFIYDVPQEQRGNALSFRECE